MCAGLAVTYETADGQTLLHLAAVAGKLNIATYLVQQHNIDSAFVNKQTTGGSTSLRGSSVDTAGWTALHFVCVLGLVSFVQYLLEQGADKNVKTSQGETAVSLAKKYKQEKILPLLGVQVPVSKVTRKPAAKSDKKASGHWTY